MNYRRLFIMRKDLQMSPGKLAAQVSHCAEAYWTNKIRKNSFRENDLYVYSTIQLDREEYDKYINNSFIKTICEARNKNHLLKAKTIAEELGLIENVDFGLIRDNCCTELTPEDADGRTLTGIWFKPLPDEIAHKISKKYQLYKG